jgi:hypothetical protein
MTWAARRPPRTWCSSACTASPRTPATRWRSMRGCTASCFTSRRTQGPTRDLHPAARSDPASQRQARRRCRLTRTSRALFGCCTWTVPMARRPLSIRAAWRTSSRHTVRRLLPRGQSGAAPRASSVAAATGSIRRTAADFQMGSGAFTSMPGSPPTTSRARIALIGCGNGTANTALEFFLVTDGNQLQFSVHAGRRSSIASPARCRLARRTSRVACEAATTFSAPINGVAGSSASLGGGTVTLNNPTGGSISSGRVQTLYAFDGMIDDVRVTKGVARSLTELPTAAFPNF